MKNTVRMIALGCIVLFQNSLGVSTYLPPFVIRPAVYVDEYSYTPVVEMEAELPLEVNDAPPPLPTIGPEIGVGAPRSEIKDAGGKYIEKYWSDAHGGQVPPTIKMAQGLLESDKGRSSLVSEANNHFGMKCHDIECPPGHCINKHDDSVDDNFLRFRDAAHSFRAHDKLLTGKPRYSHLFTIPCTDDLIELRYNPAIYWVFSSALKKKKVRWNGQPLVIGAIYTLPGKAWWCIHLCAAGYATDPHYADKLYRIIKRYDL